MRKLANLVHDQARALRADFTRLDLGPGSVKLGAPWASVERYT
jgi:TorA maturation chaperone TorD